MSCLSVKFEVAGNLLDVLVYAEILRNDGFMAVKWNS